MDNRFNRQTAFITGGARGLGYAIADRLAREGARVVLFDRDRDAVDRAAAALTKSGLAAEGLAGDVTDEQSVADAIAQTVARHPTLDVVINSAGIVGPNATKTQDVAVADFDQVYAVNLRGSFLIAKHSLLAMAPRGRGRILLIASIAGKEGNAGMCAYSATKAGVIGLVKSAGKEYAETDITINGLAPAVVWTDMVANVNPAQVKYMTDKIPMKRCGTLDEVAAIACWIVSPEASFTTGFTFDLSGGRATY